MGYYSLGQKEDKVLKRLNPIEIPTRINLERPLTDVIPQPTPALICRTLESRFALKRFDDESDVTHKWEVVWRVSFECTYFRIRIQGFGVYSAVTMVLPLLTSNQHRTT
jgi:hypothetical protein